MQNVETPPWIDERPDVRTSVLMLFIVVITKPDSRHGRLDTRDLDATAHADLLNVNNALQL